MTRKEAAEILQQMINAIHPVTGEVLPEEHLCAETLVIRALHMGYAALMQTGCEEPQAKEREAFVPAGRENTHNVWTDEEDQYLHEAWVGCVTVDEMRRHLRRTLRSVKCRLVYLGLAEYAILERKYQPPKGCEHSGLPWYPEEEDAIRAFYAAGVNLRDVARQLKRSFRAVVMHMVGMELLTEEERDALLLQHKEGGTPS